MREKLKVRWIIVIVIVLCVVYNKGPAVYDKIYYELTKDKLMIEDVELIEYSSLDELGENVISDAWVITTIAEINNYAYTISEHNLQEWYHDLIYNYPSGNRQILWFIYDLAKDDNLCYRKATDTEFCYVSEEETRDIVFTMIRNGEEENYSFFGTGQVESSKHGIIVYESAESALLEEAIDNAYIISQGPNTSGYEEAMKRTYELSQYNQSTLPYPDFEEYYYNEVKDDDEVLEKLKNMSTLELFENYDRYYSVIRKVATHVDDYMYQKKKEARSGNYFGNKGTE